MVGTTLRAAAKVMTAVALCLPAVAGGTTAHAANGAVDSATFEGGLCDFEGVFPDASGQCLASVSVPLANVNGGVTTFPGSGSILEPAGDWVSLSYSAQVAQVTPSCSGCPGVATAVVVGSATDEGVTCPLVGDLDLAYVGSIVVVVAGNLTWEGC